MATKKQKRAAAEAKHEKWVAEMRESGLEALRRDKEHRELKRRDAHREKHDKKHSWKKIDKDCLLCQDLIAEQNRQQKLLEQETAALDMEEASNSG